MLIEVLPQHRFDEMALWRHLETRLDGFSPPATIRQFQGGQSNPTFLVESAGNRWVLRKKPPGRLLPSAHLVEREFRVLQALEGRGVPVPRVRMLCTDDSVIGTPFYLMDFVAGRIVSDITRAQLARAERREIYLHMARVLAAIHGVDWRAAGLADFGKPERYLARQVERWSRQYAASKTEDDPAMMSLIAWLERHLPPDEEVALVHGDYRLGNLILHPAEPRVVAVVDWELATLGAPLGDLGYVCMYYHLPHATMTSGLAGMDLAELGVPAEQEFIAEYCRHAGREPPRHWTFYLAFSLFRTAAITQGVYARALQGNAADSRAIEHGRVSRLAAGLGWSIARRTPST